MNAHPILLQMKYARIVDLFSKEEKITRRKALDLFYNSKEYKLVSRGISDMHCMSDGYISEDLAFEYENGYSRYSKPPE